MVIENNKFRPFLSEYDPSTSGEGSIFPLGIYPISNTLAVKLVPGVRERQKHVRFLTAMAVSSVVCSDFDEDSVASDGISEPWQVFEWYMVEGLVKKCDINSLSGLPGRDKAAAALRDGLHLSASRYLKTPSVFGFHGVYRVLAQELDIIDSSGYLGETGYKLIKTWEEEQNLKGFYDNTGKGAGIRGRLYSAVRDGLNDGRTSRTGGWGGWNIFKKYFHPLKIGKEEGKVIFDALRFSEEGFRKEIIEFMISDRGQRVWKKSDNSEREFHRALKGDCRKDLNILLKTIMELEMFSRLLYDAFDECRKLSTQYSGGITFNELSKSKLILESAERVSVVWGRVYNLLEKFNLGIEFQDKFSLLYENDTPEKWVKNLILHHNTIQRNKPPNGKNPWFEVTGNDKVYIRPKYRTDEGAKRDDSYVYYYRTNPLWSFMQDLGKV